MSPMARSRVNGSMQNNASVEAGHRRDSGSGASSSSSSGGAGIIGTSLRHHATLHPIEQPSPLRCFVKALTRKKPLDCRTDTNLNRCLNLVHLTALGVGSTLGLGLYVLAGQVASNKAGPGVVISFGLAALASAFSALCYAEFAGRVPRAGSAYAYSYITVGEFVAFVIGWNLILEYVIGASSVARGFSGYLQFVYEHLKHSIHESGDQQPQKLLIKKAVILPLAATASIVQNNSSKVALVANATTEAFRTSTVGSTGFMNQVIDYVVRYFDWPSVAIIVVLTVFILLGVRDSTNVNLIFTVVNILVVLVVVISSIKHLNLHNWFLDKSEVPPGHGEGGFLPYGWSGVLAGSATCFFGFIGFDTIASSAEEAKNPKRNVPLSIILSLFISFIAYMSIAIVQTLLWPYYDQDKVTILPYIFGQLGMPITYWIVLVGAVAGLSSSQLGGMFPLPRILYAMAQDKLIYGSLAHINTRLKLPVRATIIGSVFVAILACLLDIQDLADMVSIGTLAAYSLVSLSVLILRYEDRRDAVDDSTLMSNRLSFTDILSASTDNLKQQPGPQQETTLTTKEPLPDQAVGGERKKNSVARQPSIPIRERGSRPLVGQLSVGFQSWFKPTNEEVENGQQEDAVDVTATPLAKKANKRSVLGLLIKWKSEEFLPDQPDDESSRMSKVLIVSIIILTIILDVVALCLTSIESPVSNVEGGSGEHMIVKTVRQIDFVNPMTLLSCTGYITSVALVAATVMLSRLPTSDLSKTDSFQVPLVPLIPTLSILVNTFLMLNLSFLTWVRFTVWMTVGLFIYFTYGLWNSQGYLLHVN